MRTNRTYAGAAIADAAFSRMCRGGHFAAQHISPNQSLICLETITSETELFVLARNNNRDEVRSGPSLHLRQRSYSARLCVKAIIFTGVTIVQELAFLNWLFAPCLACVVLGVEPPP